MSGYQSLIYEVKDGIAVVTFNRPDVMNALNEELSAELRSILTLVEQDIDVRALILTGGDKCFCSGADIKESMSLKDAPTMVKQQRVERSRPLFDGLANCSKPTIAAISGVAMGAGCEMALACDFRIASETLKIALSEVKIGIVPAGGGTQRLPRLVGIARAKEMILLGKTLNAQEALQIGLVNKVVSVEELMNEAQTFASQFINLAPITLSLAKKLINKGMEMSLIDAIDYETQCATLLGTTEDRLEGMKAFSEKRKPVFKGR